MRFTVLVYLQKTLLCFDIASQICTALPYGVCPTSVSLTANCTKKFDTVHKICVKIPKVDIFQKQIWRTTQIESVPVTLHAVFLQHTAKLCKYRRIVAHFRRRYLFFQTKCRQKSRHFSHVPFHRVQTVTAVCEVRGTDVAVP